MSTTIELTTPINLHGRSYRWDGLWFRQEILDEPFLAVARDLFHRLPFSRLQADVSKHTLLRALADSQQHLTHCRREAQNLMEAILRATIHIDAAISQQLAWGIVEIMKELLPAVPDPFIVPMPLATLNLAEPAEIHRHYREELWKTCLRFADQLLDALDLLVTQRRLGVVQHFACGTAWFYYFFTVSLRRKHPSRLHGWVACPFEAPTTSMQVDELLEVRVLELRPTSLPNDPRLLDLGRALPQWSLPHLRIVRGRRVRKVTVERELARPVVSFRPEATWNHQSALVLADHYVLAAWDDTRTRLPFLPYGRGW